MRTIAALFFATALLCGSSAKTLRADDAKPDLRTELPRIPPLEPAEARKTFEILDGFKLEQIAAEPLVASPVAMCFDERGRAYVVEMRDYSEQDKEKLGRVKLLEDTNHDGTFDRATIFAKDLSWPTAICCFDGGVFVSAAPDIFYLKDTNGDLMADERRIVFTGFGRGNVQGLLNSFRWTLDNRIHGATSSAGGVVTRPDVKEFRPVELRGRDFSFDPKLLDLRAESGGGQHGLSFDDWGRKFVCSNSRHAQYIAFEDRYVARNPHFAGGGALVDIAVDGGQAPVFRSSPVEPWRTVRTRLRVSGQSPGIVEGGGRPAGYFTGATGITIYRGDACPDLRGMAFIGDVGSNIVHRKQIVPQGVLFSAARIDAKSEFVRSSDIWFRPVQFENGPDGCLHILDMYREVIEHPASLPEEIKQHLDLTSGRERGRLYRAVPAAGEIRNDVDLSKMTSAELVGLLSHPNAWHRETAARLLFERADRSIVPLLEEQAAKSTAPLCRLHSLYVLQGLKSLRAEVVAAALANNDERIREHALKLAENFAENVDVQRAAAALVDDSAIHVRYQFSFTAGAFPAEWKGEKLARVLKRDGQNSWFRAAAMSSLAEGAGEALAVLLADGNFRVKPENRAILDELVILVARKNDLREMSRMFALWSTLPDDVQRRLMLSLLRGNPSAASVIRTTPSGDHFLSQLLQRARSALANPGSSRGQRIEAIGNLRFCSEASDIDVLFRQLDASRDRDVQLAAFAALRDRSDAKVAEGLLKRWRSFTPALRRETEEALFGRIEWTREVVAAMNTESIPARDFSLDRWRTLSQSKDKQLASAAKAILAQLQTGSRGEIVRRYESAVRTTGDPARGREIFRKECAVCHRIEGNGFEIGPDLAKLQSRTPETLLLSVLDPNREVNPQFLNYAASLSDGRAATGMIRNETSTSLTLVRAENQSDPLLRADIEDIESTGLSLMPEGFEQKITPDQMADLLAYLASVR